MAKANNKENNSFPDLKIRDKIESTILDTRRIFLNDAIDNDSADDVIRKLWFLDIQSPGKPILFIINSPGGAVDSGFAIWDQVKMISSPVYTLITGLAASMGSVLSLCAEPKNRFATPNARIMIHQPRLGGVIQGQATDLEIQAKEMLKTRKRLVDIYVEATGKTEDEIERAIDRDTWYSAEEAKNFGLLSRIITTFKEIEI